MIIKEKSFHRDTMIIQGLNAVVGSWFKKFTKAERYISGLDFAYHLAGKNIIDILVDYLKYLGFKLPAAAKIVNLRGGVSSFLVIFTAHISNAYLGLFNTIVLANVFYLIGLVMFCIASYRVDSIAAYPVDSIAAYDMTIVFVALFFLAVGISGTDFLLELFLSDQRRLRPSDPTVVEDQVHRVSWSWRPYAKLLLITVVSFVLQYFISRKLLIIIVTIASLFAGFLYFLSGHSNYKKRPLTGGPLETIILVFKAAILNRHREYPTKPRQFHENGRSTNILLPSIPLFRWLDKAAIPESSSNDRLCTAAQVQEVKSLLTMIPMWAAFLVYSIVGAAGDTFFFEQASYMDKDIYLLVFIICQALAFLIASDMGKELSKLRFLKTLQRLATLIRIGIGMLCSLFCCIVALGVEKFRLSTVDTQSTEDMQSTVGMHVLWLTPQFVLLGCMVGFAEEGLSEFFKTQVSGSMRDYGPAFNEFIPGIGKFINAIFIVIFKDWIGEDLESSHLDKYYKFLVCLSSINFFLFVSVSVWYGNQQVEKEYLVPMSIILPHHGLSIPPQRSRLPKLQRFFTAIGNEKEEFRPPVLQRFFTAIRKEKEA